MLHPTNCFLEERGKKHVTSIRKVLSVESVMLGYVRELAPVTLSRVLLRLSNDRSIHHPSTSGYHFTLYPIMFARQAFRVAQPLKQVSHPFPCLMLFPFHPNATCCISEPFRSPKADDETNPNSPSDGMPPHQQAAAQILKSMLSLPVLPL